jgi:hypothetical protein
LNGYLTDHSVFVASEVKMGCIKPVHNATQPTARSTGRLAFTLGSAAIDATAYGKVTTQVEAAQAKQAVHRASNEIKAATTLADVAQAASKAKAALEAALSRATGTSEKQSIRDRLRHVERLAANRRMELQDSLQVELAALRTGAGTTKQLGDFSEAVAAGLAVTKMGHYLLQQHNPGDSSHGLDIETVDSDGKVWTIEVKGTRVPGKLPSGTSYPIGTQTGAAYVHDRSQNAHVVTPSPEAVGAESDQLGSLLVQVNLPDNEVTVWAVDASGKRIGPALERYNLDEVAAAIDNS